MRFNAILITKKHLPFTILLFITIFSGIVLTSNHVSADTEVIDTVELTVPVACTMSGTGQTSHNATLNPGTYSGASGSEYEAGIGKTTITTYCNDNNGFSIYAIGFTGDLYEGESHTKLVGQNTNQSISTKVYANGDTDSNWSMKVNKVDNPVSGDPITYNPDNMSIQNSFNSWHTVPDVYTKVAEYHSSTTDPSTTDTTLGAKLETTYATYISSSQPADTYTGQVKYTMVHPYDRYAPEAPYFQVFYTGRPVSTTPGEENPVKIRMSELPESGKYNLLGTEDGLYDKLTPDTLYAGYFTYNGILDEFEAFLEDYEVYNGSNIDWSLNQYQTVDAASITPINETIYMVKEAPTGYLSNYIYYIFNYNSGRIDHFRIFSAIDDVWFSNIGYKLDDTDIVPGLAKSYTFTGKNPDGSDKIDVMNPYNCFGDYGVNTGFMLRADGDSLITVGEHTTLPYWITMDNYKVTGTHAMVITLGSLYTDDLVITSNDNQYTITKVETQP